ncbi:MAG: phosphoglycerate mutase (2,3-diphosphoglycerate-independent) [Candidatus Doudnabacteria bacterium RIFCSPLOWO2_02_FULL_42_9]|uniref:2,3-bisphosphoglycerate-independent phosphoglycerate mutase n=1 Tax=Candidatus Doudnabacteria bacterium RIFCSPHIGHO2_01_FULL_41_86 TaxID=1817821 RepID=A0A1F5N993_9BACT|nr:MAG: phosphoglycerate mutase (2,3-diphosphoglycerate-independent) [Candidatus Doudnabacteria bacterium RIFCSPHIGHO2_01_FULL_41_86]OGE75049.1 MAG: phosphoglycerate mutase (2,3-diphosphoglycerate-independent) [Candidatus Doudnabacteria bacterium RIFCSPHIGHO2_01_43_10]OGE85244.1 MAG: phosphoglycerate mutase (2,3-diphosphoglycerate-independent) [Candidatus Doudnabacteria bacterium RIFCSPHIGHO2_12_FULL_42_22]OGE86782.1 MAG: phosphoglycerate mutase (2,3-diphosphoglycerate-independent) [Candidatus D
MEFKPYKKMVLVVLDGFGIATDSRGNAVTQAHPANFDYLVNNFPACTLQASGATVGLPWGEMGNSEVGHLNLGAGRIVAQDLARITLSIDDRSFFTNPVLLAAAEHVKKNNSALHLMGLASTGGVHSHIEHLYALMGLAAEQGLTQVFIHMFLDGRDTPPQIALETIQKLNQKIEELGVGKIATITGRFYAMDRGEHWNLTEQTYRAMAYGIGKTAYSALEAIQDSYSQDIYDEMVVPTVIVQSGGKPVLIESNDAVICFNFRPDRVQQITRAFVSPDLDKFKQPRKYLENLLFVTMTEFGRDYPVQVAFQTKDVTNTMSEIISQQGLRQFHIAESEKYAHVSLFFNGGKTTPFPGEDWRIVSSPASNYQNYLDVPEMSARQVTEELIAKFSENYSFYLINFANGDMVGHTGDLNASIQSITVLDECIKKIADACLKEDICLIITADHGNVEELIDHRSGGIDKEHSTSPVPFILVSEQFRLKNAKQDGVAGLASMIPVGVLSDVAPTMLELMGTQKPPEMTGVSLLDQLVKSEDYDKKEDISGG